MRPKFMLRLALTAFFAAEASVASAASVTNRDQQDHTVTVIEGDAKVDHLLKPNGTVDGICLKGCLLRLNGSDKDEYELEGPEIVSIEDGVLYYDGPEPGQAAPGATPPSVIAPPPPAGQRK